jgi:hypothetical protein
MKARKCKYCRQPFEPITFLQKNCFDPNCVTEWIQETKQKEWTKKKAKLKAELMTKSDYTKILQQLVNKYVRMRDIGKPCISCEKPITGKTDAGHLFSVGNYPSVRFDLRNIFAQCITCNQFNGGNIHEYRKNLINKIGITEFEDLERKAHETRKFSIPEINEMIKEFKQKIKNIENN